MKRSTRMTITGMAVALVLTSVSGAPAQAAPNCTFEHDLNQIADNTGGYWRLQLDLDCSDRAAVRSSEWSFSLWSEPPGGGPARTFFTSDGTPVPETRSRDGGKHLVQVGAPLGEARYCYTAQVRMNVPDPTPAPDPVHYVGTHCVNA